MKTWAPLFLFSATILVPLFTAGCSSSPPPISVTLAPSASKVDQGQKVNITATVNNDRNAQGVTWSLSGPGSLSVDSLTNTGAVYTAPAPSSASSSQTATITATSIADKMANATVQITVNPYPQVPNQTLPDGSVGNPYSQTVTLTGGTPPFQWSVYNGRVGTGWYMGGAVPDGLQLDSTTGTISGTPTGAGTWYFDAIVTDAAGITVDNGFLKIQVNPTAPGGNPVPLLNQPLAPTAVSPGSGPFTLHASGSGFVFGAAIDFNGTPLTTTFVDSQHLTANVPATSVAKAETASVTVVNPGPGGGSSNVIYFQVATPETTVSFANASSSPLQYPNALGVAAGDFNEDGKPDLAIAAGTEVYALLGKGDGTFTLAPNSPIKMPSPPYNDAASPDVQPIAVGDFNHSGHLGLAVGEYQNEAAVILVGKGDGTFVPSSAAFADTQGMPTDSIQAADFNGDGNLDLAITNEFLGASPVVLGYGRGAFNTAGDLFTGIFPVGVAVGDFNQDGKLDAAVAGAGTAKYPGSGVNISLGKGDGTFTLAGGSGIPLGTSLAAIVAADFNGDGILDLAVTDEGGNTVMILPGLGDGTFGAPITYPVGNQPEAIVAGDFNNDGNLDLAIANYADRTVTLLLGNGDGTFTPVSGSPFAVGASPIQIAAADFNGDGRLDLAIANSAGVSILLQQ
jgi:hypothetical protein